MTLLEGMSECEGFNVPNSRSQRNNSPGDLMWGPEAHAFGATHGDIDSETGFAGYAGFAVFSDAAEGWKALQDWLSVPAKFHDGPLPGYFTDPNGTTLVEGYLGATLAQVVYR